MPKKLNWKALFKKKFNKRATLLNFIDFNLSGIINKSNKSNCTVCSNNANNSHKMESILLLYNGSNCNQIDLCAVRYKITHCLNSQDYFFLN